MKHGLKILVAFLVHLQVVGADTFAGKVTSVVDGDTFIVTTADKKTFKIGLYGI